MRKINRLFSVILIIMIVFSGCSIIPKVKNNGSIEIKEDMSLNKYIIDAELDSEKKLLKVTQQIRYRNNETIDLNELYFHVYANSFKKKETAPFLFGDFDRAYKDGFKPGYTEIESVYLVQGDLNQKLNYMLQGEGSTIMKVELPNTLKQGKDIILKMKYTVHIPPAGERFGYGKDNFNMGNWYPIAAVYDEDGWNLDKYYAIGDPFYSDISNYEVNIKAPKSYIVAASGELEEQSNDANNTLWSFKADNMRDFAFVASSNFKVKEKNVDGTVVKSYYYSDDNKKGNTALEFGIKSILTFNNMYGKYPYPNFSVVETEFPSGMEYPGLVYISDEYYNEDFDDSSLIVTIVHEAAHQWWYGLVGNDQVDEAWLDESFAAYSETLFIEKEFGNKQAKGYFDDTVKSSAEEAISGRTIDGVILKSLKEFKSWDDYGPTVYDSGAVMLDALRQKLGDKVFFDVIKTYFETYKFKIAHTEDFTAVCEKVSGRELDDFFKPWLKAKK